MTRRMRIAVLSAGSTIAMLASACSSDDEGDDGSGTGPSGQIIVGEGTDFPQNMMRLIASGNAVSNANLHAQLASKPFKVYPDFSLRWNEDFLAAEPKEEMVGGKQTITYQIHPDAVWSDGEPITATDFIFEWNLQKSQDPAEGGCASLLSTVGWEQIDGVVQGEDEKTAVVTFATPFPDWKDLFGGLHGASHLFDTGDPAQNCQFVTDGWPTAEGFPENLSSGPYQLLKENIDVDQNILTLTPNPNWWGEEPKLERIVISNITNDPAGTVKAMQNQDVQMVYPQPQLDLIKQLQELEPDVTTDLALGLSFDHIDLNTRNPHLGILEVRQAIALGLDRQAIVDDTAGQVDDRVEVLNNRFWMNNQEQYEDTSDGQYDEQDVDGARALLESVGYTEGADGIYVSPSGQPLELELMTTEANPLREQIADIVIEQLGKVGIGVTKFLNPDIFAGIEKPKSLEAGGFDMALFGWVGSPYITGKLPQVITSTADAPGQNYTLGGDPRVDDLMAELSTETDETQWGEITNEADRYLWENVFTIPLYQKPTILSYASQYDGPETNPTNAGPLWNAQGWALVE